MSRDSIIEAAQAKLPPSYSKPLVGLTVPRTAQQDAIREGIYDHESARIATEISLMTRPVDVPKATTELASMAQLWENASRQERSVILHTILHRVDVDLDTKTIRSIEAQPEFA